MTRRTKVIATVGPASEDEATLKAMIGAGMDVARLGLAHETLEIALERCARIRRVAADVGRPIGVLVDLPGPKVRAGVMPPEGAVLLEGTTIRVTPGTEQSSAEVITVDYPDLLSDVHIGDHLAFGDGAVVVEAIDKRGDSLEVRILHGGPLKGRPGVHIPSDRLRITAPTPDDLRMLDAFVEVGVDMVALSFVRSAHDIRRVGTEPVPRGPLVVAKIETRAAVQNMESIIEASGAVMVARGDLGAECPIEELPHLQKQIIQRCIALGRPAITATQMLESMISAPSPTRAEASDVANAVFDGTSALMLSAETAIGSDPVNVVETMARIAGRADQEFDYSGWANSLAGLHSSDLERQSVDDAVTNAMSMAAWRAATETGAAAIICITRTGFTVRSIARFRPQARILGFSTDERTVHQLTMSWGADPALISGDLTLDEQIDHAVNSAHQSGLARAGDLLAVLHGSTQYPGQATDTLRLVRLT
ncbi:MAG: pyruvate kinase [Acidimicrobiia bacterium]|nr:pyruvate kinase [Acidimicrobiia bacterium]